MEPVSQNEAPQRRYPRTSNGLVGALIVTVLAVVVFVALRSFFSADLNVEPDPIDYFQSVDAAQGIGDEVVYPRSLPAGWRVTSLDYDPTSGRKKWGLGILTDTDSFVGLRQQDRPLRDLLKTYVDNDPAQGDTYRADGSVATTWETYTDSGGDRAYASMLGQATLLVYGSASADDQQTLLSLLTTEKDPDAASRQASQDATAQPN